MSLGIEEGEKATKYFFNLEKRNYNRKTINEIKLENDEIITDQTQILSMVQTYYSNLYNSQATDSQDSFEIFTESMEIPRLDGAERDALDGPLTYEECKKTLESCTWKWKIARRGRFYGRILCAFLWSCMSRFISKP